MEAKLAAATAEIEARSAAALAATLLFNWRFLFFAPLFGYGLAWYSHFYVEENIPASFGHPVWSLLCDFKMFFFMITGQMDSEIKRLAAVPRYWEDPSKKKACEAATSTEGKGEGE
ncbi:L-rhamnose-proton symporter like protein [Tanacetum coccineum]